MINPIDIITWGGRKPEFIMDLEYVSDVKKNIEILCERVNKLIAKFREENPKSKWVEFITSGFRPKWYEFKQGRTGSSAHCQGMAVDLHDPLKEFGQWIQDNESQLEFYDLYLETCIVTHKDKNPNKRWIHLSTRPPKSKKRIFIP